jgi:hypothetical protein
VVVTADEERVMDRMTRELLTPALAMTLPGDRLGTPRGPVADRPTGRRLRQTGAPADTCGLAGAGPRDEGPEGEVPNTLTVGARGRWSARDWSCTVGSMSQCDAVRHATSRVLQ